MKAEEVSYRNIIAAMNYETLCRTTSLPLERCRNMFQDVSLRCTVYEPLLLHLKLYSEISSVPTSLLADAYLEVKRGFLQLKSNESALWEEDPLYPQSLLDHVNHPPFIFIRGNLSLLNTLPLSVTGTQFPSNQGRRITEEVVGTLREPGIPLITTLEKGIEGIAQLSHLSQGGKSVLFLASPLHQCTVEEHRKLQQYIGEHGLLISPISPTGEGRRDHLPLARSLSTACAGALALIEERDGGQGVKRLSDAIEQKKTVCFFRHSLEDRSRLWPRKYSGSEGVHIVEKPADIISHLRREEKEERKADSQLFLF